MSRVGKQPIMVPAGVKVALKEGVVHVEGPKGKLHFKPHSSIKVDWSEGDRKVTVSTKDASGESAKFWGTARAIIRNMVEGVHKGYEKQLEVVGVGWQPAMQGKKLKLTVGFANSIMLDIPEGLTVTVDKQLVKIAGADKQLVGMFASNTRAKRKPEPYNGKGIKYVGEVIRRKQGKQFGA